MVDQQAELRRVQQEKATEVLAENDLGHDALLASTLDTRLAAEKVGTKLDLACGVNPRPGYTGVDLYTEEELAKSDPHRYERNEYGGYRQANLLEFPWPFEDSSVAAAYSSHFVEHIPHHIVGQDPKVDGWWLWFQELYRIMEDGGIVEIIHPFSRSDRAFWDPTHTRYIHFQTWFYLQRETRLQLGVNHYAPEVDFEVCEVQAIREPTYLQGKNDQVKDFVRQFYWNVTDDLFIVLRANK